MRRMSWLKIYYAFIVLERTVGIGGGKWRRNILGAAAAAEEEEVEEVPRVYIDSVGRKINLIFDVYFTFNLTIILIINLQIINENYSYCLRKRELYDENGIQVYDMNDVILVSISFFPTIDYMKAIFVTFMICKN